MAVIVVDVLVMEKNVVVVDEQNDNSNDCHEANHNHRHKDVMRQCVFWL